MSIISILIVTLSPGFTTFLSTDSPLSSGGVTSTASITVTFVSFIALAPSLSVTLYTTLYIPSLFIFTVLSITSTFDVISPSSLSIAFTYSNGLNLSPTFNIISFIFITGSLFTSTLILRSFIAILSSLSIT